jgi:hypothetical protein
MFKVLIADPIRDASQIRDIFWEYLQWANQEIIASYQVSFDIRSILEKNMLELHPFLFCMNSPRLAGSRKPKAHIN